MVRVLATGTFDLLHPGHLLYLSEARALGDELYVIVARDSMIKHKQKPIVPEDQRLEMVQALRVVDKAMLGSKIDIFEPIREIRPDVIALGPNQFFKEKDLEEQLKVHGLEAKVVRIKSFRQCELCSSAAIMRKVIERGCSTTMHKEQREIQKGIFAKVEVCPKCEDEWVDEKEYETLYQLFTRKTFKIGGSIAVRIPKELAILIGLKEGSEVKVAVKDKKLVIEPAT